ncbi:protein indeterminate-domain 12-like [Chenopodium quinoa]|uniref:protein indeterminate-domain 12-like n=1 Tax=Chenopodium quinoa TaxID=63459 RepID=UPI000B77CC00|nr:protein indeterminate-domain 12-like [Chenopodium quinoa]
MFQGAMSNSTLSEEANSLSSFNPLLLQNTTNIITSHQQQQQPPPPKKVKKKRSLPGNPDPDAEVIALSPKTLLATNRFICEICNKGFQRDQNLQLHRRGHNLPWKLKQRSKTEVIRKKAYVCPEPSCVHHHPSRALGDLTGIKKHFCRKHGEKKYKCEKCSKIYAVQSDWKAHSKTCGTREYRCDCGTLFSRKDSFITHRAFCDALAEESARLSTNPFANPILPPPQPPPFSTQNPNSSLFPFITSSSMSHSSSPWDPNPQNPNPNPLIHIKTENPHFSTPPPFFQPPSIFTNQSKSLLTSLPFTSSDTSAMSSAHFLSATALLQKATTVGAVGNNTMSAMMNGFDELGAMSRHMGPPTTDEMSSVLPPHSSSSTNTNSTNAATTTPTDHPNNADHFTAMLNTWRKNNDGMTRDFLGLTAGDYNTNAGGGGGFNGDEVVGNMLKFTGGLQYGMTAPYDRDNSSSSVLLKHDQQPLDIHQQHHHHQQVDGFGFVSGAEPPTTAAAAAAPGSRWG